MLADRFRLTAHLEQRPVPVYGLIVDKKGIKFQAVPEGRSDSSTENTHYEGKAVSMTTFAAMLSRHMDLPVLDMTGLKGFYGLKLDWVREPRGGEPADDSPAGPRVPEALQDQLGLKQFLGIPIGQLPRVYLATPAEVAQRMRETANGRGDSILYENHTWGPRAFGAGTVGQIPQSWIFSLERVEELLGASAG